VQIGNIGENAFDVVYKTDVSVRFDIEGL